MQLPGSEVGCVVRKIKLEGVCMLGNPLQGLKRMGRRQRNETRVSVSMGSGCVCAARASAAGREAPQEGLQSNLSVANGRKQLQNAMRTYLVWVSFRRAALPGKNAHREQAELHSMVWTDRQREQLLRAQPPTRDGSRSQRCPHRKQPRAGTGWG